MKHIQYNKLVRDRIPEIIESSGKTCKVEILSDEDYLSMIMSARENSFLIWLFP